MERTRGEILVVSQGLKLAEPLRLQLAAEGWGVRQLRQFVSPSDQADGKRTALMVLVVLDLQPPMPGGLKTCQELRASSSVPLIALLPWADPDLTTTVLDLGADDCLAGPINPRELILRIRAVLRRAGDY